MLGPGIDSLRQRLLEHILAAQDDSFRWGHDEKQARLRPEYLYYSPNFKSTLWTLVLLADIGAPADDPRILPSLRLITAHFYDPEAGIFCLPGRFFFPIPCLNGNMLYLHHYFKTSDVEALARTIDFFAANQRFDDGDFKTPKTYPYCANTSCYGKHTCFWSVTKLLKGLSFIPRADRSGEAQALVDRCVGFVLQHEVCFSSRHAGQLLHRDIDKLTFPNFYKSDFLEILWLLAREEVRDTRITPALELLRSKMKEDHSWQLEKPKNTIVSIGPQNAGNAFISARAAAVLEFYGR